MDIPAPELDYEQAIDQNQDWLTGWSVSHDYDPTWDYDVAFEWKDHELLDFAQNTADQIARDFADHEMVHFETVRVFPARLEDSGVVAVYCSGTYAEPVVLIDFNTHIDQVDDEADLYAAISDSVTHELRHAVQEANELDMDETDAEYGSLGMPF